MTATTPSPRTGDSLAPEIIALLYGRNSADPKKRGRSVKAQFADGEAECAIREWPVGGRYQDIGRSASRYAKKPREEWQQLVERVEQGPPPGKQYAIVYAEASRSNRDLAVYVQIRSLCERTNTLLCYGGRVYDMRIAADRDATAQDALQSEREANNIQYRNSRTARLNAAKGGPHGVCPFGYTRRYSEEHGELLGQFPDPVNGPLVLEAFQRAARRESLYSITAWFVELGCGPQRVNSLRKMLTNPAYIGIRSHNGKQVKATWDPIVPEALFWKVQEILKDPTRLNHRTNRAEHLLSGIATCGVCGHILRAGYHWVKGERKALRYTCGSPRRCASLWADRMEAWVEEHLLAWLASEAAEEAFRPRDDGGEQERARARIAAMKAQLDEARESASTIDEATGLPTLSVASLAALERRVLPLLEREEQALRAAMASGDPLLDGLRSAEDVEAAWEGLDLDQRRHVLRVVCRVRLNRAPARGVSAVDEMRVPLVFVGEPGFDGQD